jgi:restriction endonuclease Mrr
MNVDVDQIRLFQGTLQRENRPGHSGIFVTLSRCTENARMEAEQDGLTLIDNRELYSGSKRWFRAVPAM